VDSSFGCVRWALYSEDLAASPPRVIEVTRHGGYVPLRGVPLEPRLAHGVLCWAASNDVKTWTLWKSSVTVPSPMIIGTSHDWIRRCEANGNAALAIKWNMSSGTGVGDLVRYREGQASLLVKGAQDFSVLGQEVLYTTQPPPGLTRELWVAPLNQLSRALSVVEFDDITAFGWLGPRQAWVSSTAGLLIVDPSVPGPSTALADSPDGVRAPAVNGKDVSWVSAESPNTSTVRIATLS
jgi:hypothetical protein